MSALKVPLFRPTFTAADVEALAAVLYSGHLTTGPRCEEFETRFASWLGVRRAVSTNSGSAALHLALLAAGIGPGDIVLVPTLGFAADAQVVAWQRATPILVDCEPMSLCISPQSVEETLERLAAVKKSKRASRVAGIPRAMIVVDYAGQMADYTALREICRRWKLLLIEDAAHAVPAAWRAGPGSPWMPPGTVADLTCFSFYANKPITTGEGGMVVTDNDRWATRMRAMRLHGFESLPGQTRQSTWNRQVVLPGFKYNLPDLAAALGIRQLAQVNELWRGRCCVARAYATALTSCRSLQLPEELPDRKHAWHIYAVRLRGALARGRRDRVMQKLLDRGVQTSVHWYPLHKQRYFRDCSLARRDFPVTDHIYPGLLSLPIFPAMTDRQTRHVANSLLEVMDEFR